MLRSNYWELSLAKLRCKHDHMLKSIIQILFNCKMWGREIEWNRKERGGEEKERKRQRQVKQKTGTTHGSNSVKGINVHWLNSSWFQMFNTCSFLLLNPKFSTNIHTGTVSFLLHSNSIRKQKNRRCRHKESGKVQHLPWSSIWGKTLWWPSNVLDDL